MAPEIVRLVLGPMENNTYLLSDSGQAVVVDPSFDSETVLEVVGKRGWELTAIWLTHAHFDHIAGVQTIQQASGKDPLPVGLHTEDLPLWQQGGGARLFGMNIEPGPAPSIHFEHGQMLTLGSSQIEVRHAPGHTPGHVMFYSVDSAAMLVGDVIFYHGIGRTDLPGGSHDVLMRSIRDQVLTLPAQTRLLSGHGPETTVEEELAENPFLP